MFMMALAVVLHFENTRAEAQLSDHSDSTVQKTEAALFDSVAEQLSSRYYDKSFRQEQLPKLIEQYRPLAMQAKTLKAQREVIFKFLSRIPATHLGLLSQSTYKQLMAELWGRKAPTFGLELIEIHDQYFAHTILEGGPAEKAGIKLGDRILRIDGKPVRDHARLDFRSDDSFLPDPPVHSLLCEENETVKFLVGRPWGRTETIEIQSTLYSSLEAAKASARIIERNGKKIGYIHFWFIHIQGIPQMLRDKLENDFKDCDAFILDLRGRGGNGSACRPIVDIVSGKSSSWKKPSVALIDRNSRSAKEVISLYFKRDTSVKLVGERTAGAVIPATFKNVGQDTVLMFPTFTLGKLTKELEGIGVQPDVAVEKWRPGIDQHDPIYEAGINEAIKMIDQGKATAKNGNSK